MDKNIQEKLLIGCKGCPDRCAEPNCHKGCERYERLLERNAQVKKNREADDERRQYVAERIATKPKRIRRQK